MLWRPGNAPCLPAEEDSRPRAWRHGTDRWEAGSPRSRWPAGRLSVMPRPGPAVQAGRTLQAVILRVSPRRAASSRNRAVSAQVSMSANDGRPGHTAFNLARPTFSTGGWGKSKREAWRARGAPPTTAVPSSLRVLAMPEHQPQGRDYLPSSELSDPCGCQWRLVRSDPKTYRLLAWCPEHQSTLAEGVSSRCQRLHPREQIRPCSQCRPQLQKPVFRSGRRPLVSGSGPSGPSEGDGTTDDPA